MKKTMQSLVIPLILAFVASPADAEGAFGLVNETLSLNNDNRQTMEIHQKIDQLNQQDAFRQNRRLAQPLQRPEDPNAWKKENIGEPPNGGGAVNVLSW